MARWGAGGRGEETGRGDCGIRCNGEGRAAGAVVGTAVDEVIVATTVNLPAAIAFYLIFPVGLTIFAVAPAVKAGAIGQAALYGGLFGLFAYATYDLTNQATLRAWSTQLTVIDVSWGFALSGVAATIGYLAASQFSAPA